MLTVPFGPSRHRKGDRMTFSYNLEQQYGTPADPPTVRTAPPTPRRHIPLSRDRRLRVIGARPGSEPDGESVLVVETA